jgi:hypothetical protein
MLYTEWYYAEGRLTDHRGAGESAIIARSMFTVMCIPAHFT